MILVHVTFANVMVAFGRDVLDAFQIAVKSGEHPDRTVGELW